MKTLLVYSGFSFSVAFIIILHAVHVHKQFYSTVVHLTTSKLSHVLLVNTSFVTLILLGQFLRWLFLGELRVREVEKTHEQTFYFVATTCLALTIFREHITAHVVAMFVVCLLTKIFHWLAQSRQEYIEQIDHADAANRWEFYRLMLLLFFLGFVDVGMSHHHVAHLMQSGPSVRLLLALEFLVLAVTCCTTMLRLLLHVVDGRRQHRWENKDQYKFYLEILSDLLQCVLYIGFFGMILYFYGVPIHLIRELFLTLRSFKKTISDFLRYRKLTACLDERFPNATEEEVQADATCIICYDDMVDAKNCLVVTSFIEIVSNLGWNATASVPSATARI
eukprot:NODE_1025_length_1155_cov_55.398734_g779_i0.p1 GENE.NODE_1025_length_1155_cov_55.398734_g779_i0~~NODE_1025_length_1155_cov_55.398734_g779_i0.p1  ORF type:complete len:335 (-),score=34.51 NODE_1025_length_1155_cov_55.398734_g779_i0:55-1059(-)